MDGADRGVAARRSGTGPGRRGGSRPLLLLALVGGLAVAALCLHAGGGAIADATGPLHADWLLLSLVVAVGGWMLVAKYHGRQNERPMGTPREDRLVTLTVTALVLTTLGTAVAVTAIGMGPTEPMLPPPQPPAPSLSLRPIPPPALSPQAPTKVHTPHPIQLGSVLIALLVIGVVVLLVLVVIAARRYLHWHLTPALELVSALEPIAEEAALSAAVSAGRLALQGEDVRAAVIACYAAMEDSLAESGLGRNASDSPADLLRRADDAGLLVGLAPQQLAALFREARYSSHAMTQVELDQARQALDDIGRLLAERRAVRAAADLAPASAAASESGSAAWSGAAAGSAPASSSASPSASGSDTNEGPVR